MTKRKYLHFRSTIVKTPRSYMCSRKKSENHFCEWQRRKANQCKTPPNLVFHSKHTIAEQHYDSSLLFSLKFRHSLFTQGNSMDAPRQSSRFYWHPTQAEWVFSTSPAKEECVEEQCFRDLPPTVQFSAIIWEAYTTATWGPPPQHPPTQFRAMQAQAAPGTASSQPLLLQLTVGETV